MRNAVIPFVQKGGLIMPVVEGESYGYFEAQKKPGTDEYESAFIATYELVKKLGDGSFATVFKALDLRTVLRQVPETAHVALKVFNCPNRGTSETVELRFAREANLWQSIKDERIPCYMTMGEFTVDEPKINERVKYSYIVSELIDGLDLVKKTNGRPINPLIAAKVVRQIAEIVWRPCETHYSP